MNAHESLFSVAPVAVAAEEVKVGDDIWFLGQPHRVLTITEHHSDGYVEPFVEWRMAHGAGGWVISLIPGDRIEVLR